MEYRNTEEACLGDLVLGKGNTMPFAIIGTVVAIESDSIVVNAAATIKDVDGVHQVTTLTPNVNEVGQAENFMRVVTPDEVSAPIVVDVPGGATITEINGVSVSEPVDTSAAAPLLTSKELDTPAS